MDLVAGDVNPENIIVSVPYSQFSLTGDGSRQVQITLANSIHEIFFGTLIEFWLAY